MGLDRISILGPVIIGGFGVVQFQFISHGMPGVKVCQSNNMISWRLNIVLHCFIWYFCDLQQIYMLCQSCLGLMPLSIVFSSKSLLPTLLGVTLWTSPYVSSTSYRIVASSFRRSSSFATSTSFVTQLRFCVLV